MWQVAPKSAPPSHNHRRLPVLGWGEGGWGWRGQYTCRDRGKKQGWSSLGLDQCAACGTGQRLCSSSPGCAVEKEAAHLRPLPIPKKHAVHQYMATHLPGVPLPQDSCPASLHCHHATPLPAGPPAQMHHAVVSAIGCCPVAGRTESLHQPRTCGGVCSHLQVLLPSRTARPALACCAGPAANERKLNSTGKHMGASLASPTRCSSLCFLAAGCY